MTYPTRKVARAPNALTVDVEDYFHVSALAKSIDRSSWSSIKPRVEQNTDKLLKIFSDYEVSATFFVLGWVAERFPGLVRRIVAGGHELASHGQTHKLIYTQDIGEFREETIRSKGLLEDISGKSVAGYRAASYSITERSLWALEVLSEAGFSYDSSIVPADHDIYGIKSAAVYPHNLVLADGRSIVEFPPSTTSIMGRRLPIGGGGYFRLFPYWFTRRALRRINSTDNMPFAFYLHPWEIDPSQPRVEADMRSTFRHYNNLEKCESRLRVLLQDFKFAPMQTCLNSLQLENISLQRIAPVVVNS